jgi:hypothetical protein
MACASAQRSLREALADTFTCSICLQVCQEPVSTKCRHVFCEMCICNWLQRQRSCPVCRELIVSAYDIRLMPRQLQPLLKRVRRADNGDGDGDGDGDMMDVQRNVALFEEPTESLCLSMPWLRPLSMHAELQDEPMLRSWWKQRFQRLQANAPRWAAAFRRKFGQDDAGGVLAPTEERLIGVALAMHHELYRSFLARCLTLRNMQQHGTLTPAEETALSWPASVNDAAVVPEWTMMFHMRVFVRCTGTRVLYSFCYDTREMLCNVCTPLVLSFLRGRGRAIHVPPHTRCVYAPREMPEPHAARFSVTGAAPKGLLHALYRVSNVREACKMY